MKTKTRSTAKSTAKAKSSKSSVSSAAKSRKITKKTVKPSAKVAKSRVNSTASAKSNNADKTGGKPEQARSKVPKKSASKPRVVVSKRASTKRDAAVKKSVSKSASDGKSNGSSIKAVTPSRTRAKDRGLPGEVRTKSGTMLKAMNGGGTKDSKSEKKISVAEKLSTSHLVKKQAVSKTTKKRRSLKLVKKSPIKVPATKISRSDSYASDSKVIMGNFSFGEEEVRPIVAQKRPVTQEEAVDGRNVVVFKSGDKIVYPGHGVGEIEGIRSTVLDGQEHHIYNITILESGMKVMVPVSQAASVGIRKIIDKQAIDEVFSILRDRDFKIDTQTWNRRFREYSQKIKTGSVFEIAIVLRDLSVLSVDKELSFGEKKMLDMAESLLVSEIALARSRSHEKVAGELRALFTP